MPDQSPGVGTRSTATITPEMIRVLGQATLAVIATADEHGECDSSLRAGPPGFVQVLDEGRVAYPEYRGNGVMASLGNLEENPQVGVLVLDLAGEQPHLHLSGPAEVVADEDLRAEHPALPVDAVPGRRTDTWVVVRVEEAAEQEDHDAPRLVPVPRNRSWGTDAPIPKGGDYFRAAARRRAAPAAVDVERTAAGEVAATEVADGSSSPTPAADAGAEARNQASSGSVDVDADRGHPREGPPRDPPRSDPARPDPARRDPARRDPPQDEPPVDDPPQDLPPQSGPPPAGSATSGRDPFESRGRAGVDLRVVVAVLAVLVVLLTAGLVVALAGSGGEPSAGPMATAGPAGPPTLYGRVVEVRDPGQVVVEVAGRPVTVEALGFDAAAIPPCAQPGAEAFARRTLDRQMVTLVPDPTVVDASPRRAYLVLASQLSYTDALIRAGWATPSGTALYRPVFDDESRSARDGELGMFGPACSG